MRQKRIKEGKAEKEEKIPPQTERRADRAELPTEAEKATGKEKIKRFLSALLFPPLWVLIPLVTVAAAALILCPLSFGTEAVPTYISYALAFYALTVSSVRTPRFVRLVREWKAKSPLYCRWSEDAGLRVRVSLYFSLGFGAVYGVFQVCLGIYHNTLWYLSFGVYYLVLSLARWGLLFYMKRYAVGEDKAREYRKYRATGVLLLVMNLALGVIVFYISFLGRSFEHHMITVIAMAAYTFLSFTIAIINTKRIKKYDSPVLSASKAIGLVCAAVSMLTLEATMLTAFGEGKDPLFDRLMLGITGAAVTVFTLVLAVYMIVKGVHGERESGTGEKNFRKQ